MRVAWQNQNLRRMGKYEPPPLKMLIRAFLRGNDLKAFHLTRSFFTHLNKGEHMLLSDFVRFTNWIFTHYPSEEVRLEALLEVCTVLFCHTKENADYGWHPFSRPLDQIYEDMIEKEVKKRVEKEERIRALKKAQNEIGKY